MNYFIRAWKENAIWLKLLIPFSLLFRLVLLVRKSVFSIKVRPSGIKIPIVVIGNITAGGTGKTSLVICLAKYLVSQGYSPGIVSRGYGGKARSYPFMVDASENPMLAGDEAVLIARRTNCPVVVDPNRSAAVDYLISHCDIDIVLSDDGLQHYKMYRDIEICVVDGKYMFGNYLCFPAGPLREPVDRLKNIDFIVINGESSKTRNFSAPTFNMSMTPKNLVNLTNGEIKSFTGAPFNIGHTVQAVCAIGNPDSFYSMLEQLPYPVSRFAFPDHYPFSPLDFDSEQISDHQPIVMTEKDAVKCTQFANKNFWFLELKVEMPELFFSELVERINECNQLIKES